MAYGYNTSANQTRNNTYTYSKGISPNTHVADGDKTFNYSEIYSSNTVNSSANKTKNKTTKTTTGVWGITMGQTQNYTLDIPDISAGDGNFSLKNRSGAFLPLKSLDYKPLALEHLKLKAGVFADLPFFHRRRLGVLNLSLLDDSHSYLSRRVFGWFTSCVSVDGYVNYIDDMCKKTYYTEYTHDGKVALKYIFYTIPEGEISVNRTYEGESGDLTEYRFQLLIVSDIKMVQGGGAGITEADWGDGYGPRADYERRVSGTAINYDGKGGTYTYHDAAIKDYMN